MPPRLQEWAAAVNSPPRSVTSPPICREGTRIPLAPKDPLAGWLDLAPGLDGDSLAGWPDLAPGSDGATVATGEFFHTQLWT